MISLSRLEEIKMGEIPTHLEAYEMAVICIQNHPETVQPEQEETDENE